MTSTRIEVLKKSLEKKTERMNSQFDNHFATVKQANGQPLNDKRNGAATLKKWEKQSDAIRNTQAEIEKTKRAIEREESLISNVEEFATPDCLKSFLASGQITQWLKHPRMFFVKGVDKARIVVTESGELAHRYLREIPNQEQYAIFRDTYNDARRLYAARL